MHNSIDTTHKLKKKEKKKKGENIEISMKYNVRQHHWLTKTIWLCCLSTRSRSSRCNGNKYTGWTRPSSHTYTHSLTHACTHTTAATLQVKCYCLSLLHRLPRHFISLHRLHFKGSNTSHVMRTKRGKAGGSSRCFIWGFWIKCRWETPKQPLPGTWQV